MRTKLIRFYQGERGRARLTALQRQLDRRLFAQAGKTEKILIWSVIPGIGGGEFCPFEDNRRPPYGNGALDRVVIIHGADMTADASAMMAEAARLIRDHGLIEVIGWTKPVYDHSLPLWARERRRIALRWFDCWSLKWRTYEKVQDFLTLSFDAGLVSVKERIGGAPKAPAGVATPSVRNVS